MPGSDEGPLVSVIIPAWNTAPFIRSAIGSVLAQTYRPIEVIVVDDGSTEGTAEAAALAADERCTILRQPRLGAAAARNAGIARSQGPLLAFLDADDVWMPAKLATQVPALLGNPAVDIVFGHYMTITGEDARTIGDAGPGYSLGTMLIRRDRFLHVGPLSTRWRVGEFIDWYARAEEAGLRHEMLPSVVLGRRVHDSNLTGRDRQARADYAAVVAAVARRRAAALRSSE